MVSMKSVDGIQEKKKHFLWYRWAMFRVKGALFFCNSRWKLRMNRSSWSWQEARSTNTLYFRQQQQQQQYQRGNQNNNKLFSHELLTPRVMVSSR